MNCIDTSNWIMPRFQSLISLFYFLSDLQFFPLILDGFTTFWWIVQIWSFKNCCNMCVTWMFPFPAHICQKCRDANKGSINKWVSAFFGEWTIKQLFTDHSGINEETTLLLHVPVFVSLLFACECVSVWVCAHASLCVHGSSRLKSSALKQTKKKKCSLPLR